MDDIQMTSKAKRSKTNESDIVSTRSVDTPFYVHEADAPSILFTRLVSVVVVM